MLGLLAIVLFKRQFCARFDGVDATCPRPIDSPEVDLAGSFAAGEFAVSNKTSRSSDHFEKCRRQDSNLH